MKCLSLTQPWATLVVEGKKQFETRSWSTKYRGPLLIHAAKGWPESAKRICRFPGLFRDTLVELGYLHDSFNLPRALIIGQVDLVGVFTTESQRERIGPEEEAFGDYGDGRFAWQLENPVIFKQPIPWKGALGLFEVTDAATAAVRQGQA